MKMHFGWKPLILRSLHLYDIYKLFHGKGYIGYYECGARLLLLENRRKIERKEIPSCLIPCLPVVFTRQLEILVTTLLPSL